MKYFTPVCQNADVTPLALSIARQPWLWNENRIRTEHPGTAHAEADDILLRFNLIPEEGSEAVIDDLACFPMPPWFSLTQAHALIFDLMRRVEGTHLGRVIITRLPRGAKIEPHVDGGAPATYFTRYQIAIQSLPGATFRIGDEEVGFRTGDVWMIDNTAEHSVVNNSVGDRIVMIVDIKS